MGNCTSQSDNRKKYQEDSISGYIFDKIIGKGGFGKVWSVLKKKTRETLAMKVMSKVKVLSKKSVSSVINERKILSQLSHPLIVNMRGAFQDRENLYLAMDYICGGDLRLHLLNRQQPFTEKQALFMAACIVSSLEYIHSKNILHRDIKPENIIFDSKGYLKITDFGISRIWKPDNNAETSGTPGYIAPEILLRQNYGVSVDYYALGVILYEIAMGRRPYKAKDRKELRDQILAKQIQIKLEELPKGWTLEAVDFINRLIQRKPSNRLGTNGPAEVKNHVWLSNFPWEKLYNGSLIAPFIPEPHLSTHSNLRQNTEPSEVDRQNALLLRKEEVQALFVEYDYSSHQINNTTPQTSGNSSFIYSNPIQNIIKQQASSQTTSISHSRQPSQNCQPDNQSSVNQSQSQSPPFLPQQQKLSLMDSFKQSDDDLPPELTSSHNLPKQSQNINRPPLHS